MQVYNKIILTYYECKRLLYKQKFFAEIDLTPNCQLNCLHCYYKNNDNHTEKSNLEWFKFFDKLYKAGVRFVLLVGGEPSLKMELIEKAAKVFPFVDVITNGQIKIPQKLNCRIFLSIDGPEKINDSLRGKDTFKTALINYKNDKRVTINFTITEQNYPYLEDVLLIAKKNNIKSVVCNVITPNVSDNCNKDILSVEVRSKIIEELLRLKKEYPKTLGLSEAIIRWYEHPNHTNYCYWKNNVLHYDYLFNSKYCFSDLDCRYCGCYAGASLSIKNPFKNKTY
jgi:MoaA/NifB/PqqE/SkfB family radical SAM enzyme